MTLFDGRERALENQFAHDQELRFRVIARRDKLFARWAAMQLASAPDGEAQLLGETLAVFGGTAHDERILAVVSDILLRGGDARETTDLAEVLHECEIEARRQIMTIPVVAAPGDIDQA